MTVYYFNDERTAYCEGPVEDQEKHNPNALFVEKMPGEGYIYNFEKKEWVKDIFQMKAIWEPKRAKLLKDTFWLLEAMDSPLSHAQKAELDVFRSQLVTLLEGDITKKEFPETPEFLKEWVE